MTIIPNCCSYNSKYTKRCLRIDGKIFHLPRRFTRKNCMTKPIRGFSMRSSCAPYKFCKSHKNKCFKGGKIKKTKTKKLQKNNLQRYKTRKNNDLFTDANPNDTISIKYSSIQDVKQTIRKLKSYLKNKKYSKKRIKLVALVMMGRLKYLQKIKPQQYKMAYNFWKSL